MLEFLLRNDELTDDRIKKKGKRRSLRLPQCFELVGWRLFRGRRQFEGLGFHGLFHSTTANALYANLYGLGTATGLLDLDFLQIGSELSSGDAGDFGTDPAQIFGLTASFHGIALGGFFATNFTHACHVAPCNSFRERMDLDFWDF